MSILVAYALTFNNKWLEISFLIQNIGFYGMETKHKVTGKLVMSSGEIGPVEIEVIVAVVLALSGYYGPAALQQTVQEKFDLAPDSMFASLGEFKLVFFFGVVFTVL